MSRLLLGLSAALLFSVAPAFADDDHPEPFDPPNEQIDRDLDDSLRREYDGNGQPLPPVDPDQDPPSSPPKEDDRLHLRLGGMAAYYYTQLKNVEVSRREGAVGGADIDLDDQGLDLDEEHSLTYRAWFDIGKFVSLQGGFRTTEYSDLRQPTSGFTFGSTTFAQGQYLETEIEVLSADFDVVIKPLNLSWIELGISFGARYVYWETRFSSPQNPATNEDQRSEALVPMVGMSLALRPVRPLELFVRGRIGHFEYEREEHYRRRSGGQLRLEEEYNKEATAAEFDAGIKLLIDDTIGLIAGYRLDFMEIESERASRAEAIKGTAHGLYAGLVIQF
ncbi:MAG: hypothetical protein R3F62_07180 [Planctomycetota bacterium]